MSASVISASTAAGIGGTIAEYHWIWEEQQLKIVYQENGYKASPYKGDFILLTLSEKYEIILKAHSESSSEAILDDLHPAQRNIRNFGRRERLKQK